MSTTEPMATSAARDGLSFSRTLFSSSLGSFSPRVGRVIMQRKDPSSQGSQSSPSIQVLTPAALTWTSRGVVPHITRDHLAQSDSVGWVHVPFESFLERTPPAPSLQHQLYPDDLTPMHTFLGLPSGRHILSLSLRDPNNIRELPPNGDTSVSAWCVRGVRKVTPAAFYQHARTCIPDVIVVPADTPYTTPPFSQRRVHKNIDRSASWLEEILKANASSERIPILLPLAGLTSTRARTVFSSLLKEPFYGNKIADFGSLGFKSLDDGVWGYLLELGPLRPSFQPLPIVTPTPTSPCTEASLNTSSIPRCNDDDVASSVIDLIKTSLKLLPVSKVRMAISTQSPHEILRLVSEVGIDLFDVSSWSSLSARRGIGFDFTFPAPKRERKALGKERSSLSTRTDGKTDIGHNLFAPSYANDFSRIALNFLDGQSIALEKGNSFAEVCSCIACSPRSFAEEDARFDPPHTRAYIHHLLHTHEMSAYALLESHNAVVVASFFSSIRSVLSDSLSTKPDAEDSFDCSLFSQEVANFIEYYALPQSLLDEATHAWEMVERSRGKGSLKRAREGDGDYCENVHSSVVLGDAQALGELIDRVKLDTPAVLMLDPSPNVDFETDAI